MGSDVEFANPKPRGLPADRLRPATQPDDLVLDGFAGAASTAEAVYPLNHEDGGSRRFIMVQLPEPSSNKRPGTIAEIGKERMRRAITRLGNKEQGQPDLDERGAPEDLGFRVPREMR